MRDDALRPVVLALLVVLAGCAGFAGGPAAGPDGGTASPATDGTDGTDGQTADAGRLRFYLSDQPSIIDEFRHLNVTVTRVGFHRGKGNATWHEFPVNGTTVDLTRLRGANATLVEEYRLPTGNYTKVFVYIGSVNGTLESGEDVRVKLPSGKLQLNKGFRLGPNESAAFVYDISVHKAGQSGKYILKPVIGESGTDVPIEEVDRDRDRERDRDRDHGRLDVAVVGNATPGQPATVAVTRNGTPVANATVFVDGHRLGTTDVDGRIEVDIPSDAGEVTIEVRAGEAEAELELEFEDRSEGENPGNGGQGDGSAGDT